jgi:hypothetical protein
MNPLVGRTSLVTGASWGIGRATPMVVDFRSGRLALRGWLAVLPFLTKPQEELI